MEKTTLEQTHALLEKLAEYVMIEIPAIKEKLDQKTDKVDMDRAYHDLKKMIGQKAEKTDIQQILEGQDALAKQLDIIRTDMKAIGGTLDLNERRLGNLEQRTFGYRVRDKDDE